MSSRGVHQNYIYDPQAGGQSSSLPPPPPRDASQSSPLRRQHVGRPLALSTEVPSSSSYSTPLSSVSRQSPFSPFATSALAPPSSGQRGISPMASRLSGHFNVTYDPRDWAPGTDPRVAQIQRARENAPEDGLASPPPPYSPSNAEQRSPRGGLERAQTMSAAQSPEPPTSFPQRRANPPSNASSSNRHSIHMGSYAPLPPPPPPVTSPHGTIPRPRIVSDMHSMESSPDPALHAPAARRAASASASGSRVPDAGPSRLASRQSIWRPGMPLPGPPPGPPPPTSRSQSTSGAFDRPGGQVRTRPQRQTMHASDLGPVPPTPSTWTEGQPLPHHPPMPLHVNTTDFTNGVPIGPGHPANPPINLSRSSAVRDSSATGLRERRANRNSIIISNDFNALSVQTNPWADALTPDRDGRPDGPLTSSPRSARFAPRATSPLALVTNQEQFTDSPIQLSSTPPITPAPRGFQQAIGSRSAGLPPKSLPTPPLSMKPPSSAQSILQSNSQTAATLASRDEDGHRTDAVQRHNDFLEKEQAARTDAERLQLFADYVLHEAALRQQKYDTAFLSGEFDVDQFRNNIFKAPVEIRSASNSISQVSADGQDPTTGNTTPQTRPETMWWKDYQPALSPIAASMDHDEMSSRGRAPSRWWESQTGSRSGSAGHGRKVHRSKRESKYMGLSKEFLMAYSPSDEYPGTSTQHATFPERLYPDEKANPESFGYFDGHTPRQISAVQQRKPETPALLDISRFITLPPPYPRHHPAVNNNHPELAQYRTTVRTLGDLEGVKTQIAKHKADGDTFRAEHKRRLSDSRRMFIGNVQAQVAEGRITYAEASEAEEAFRMSEFGAEKQYLQSEFDKLQDQVINPLHDMLHDRLAQLDASIQRLQDDLHDDARYQDPDQPQEEGDEKPELLEKLTQLKWLFDIREQIHRECFDLLTERNDKYKSIVLLPYHFSMKTDKVRETEAFFEQDARTRYIAHCDESLKRHENFLATVEQHVRRGIELQSSAFWDIAPGLLGLLQKLPENFRHFQGIQIPDKEYNENPSYHRHPQQYLYLLLSHAEKSTYQYIEGQVNLQCLLHEVRTALLVARYKATESRAGDSITAIGDLADAKAQEESALTSELKQKASMIEEQWLEALGSQLQATRERVKTLLKEENAWEEVAAEEG